jgi:hypothetical protein
METTNHGQKTLKGSDGHPSNPTALLFFVARKLCQKVGYRVIVAPHSWAWFDSRLRRRAVLPRSPPLALAEVGWETPGRPRSGGSMRKERLGEACATRQVKGDIEKRRLGGIVQKGEEHLRLHFVPHRIRPSRISPNEAHQRLAIPKWKQPLLLRSRPCS